MSVAISPIPLRGPKLAVPLRHDGDVNARIWIRLNEVDESTRCWTSSAAFRKGDIQPVEPADGEGVSVAEAFRGDVLIWVRIADSAVARCHIRDASWFRGRCSRP